MANKLYSTFIMFIVSIIVFLVLSLLSLIHFSSTQKYDDRYFQIYQTCMIIKNDDMFCNGFILEQMDK